MRASFDSKLAGWRLLKGDFTTYIFFEKIGENPQISHCAPHDSCLKIVFRVDQRAGMHFNCILSHSVDDK